MAMNEQVQISIGWCGDSWSGTLTCNACGWEQFTRSHKADEVEAQHRVEHAEGKWRTTADQNCTHDWSWPLPDETRRDRRLTVLCLKCGAKQPWAGTEMGAKKTG